MVSGDQVQNITCQYCGVEYAIIVDRRDVEAWLSGEKYIQDALGHLTAGERELFISRTCDTCWKKMYPETLDEEE
tara:strand:+ start:229 stop:453 length:225 start_codon:yes stop_codon:yes gene_type:complete